MFDQSVDLIEARLEEAASNYLFGDQMCIADLSAAYELDTIRLFENKNLQEHPRTEKWLRLMMDDGPKELLPMHKPFR